MTPKQYIPRTMYGTARSYADNPGKLFHGLLPGLIIAICGTQPGKTSRGWDPYVGKRVTCPKCLKRLALLPSDPTQDENLIFSEIGRAMASEALYAKNYKLDFEEVLFRAISALALETYKRRDIVSPSDEERHKIMSEVEEAVQAVVQKRIQCERKGEGQADSADSVPFCIDAR